MTTPIRPTDTIYPQISDRTLAFFIGMMGGVIGGAIIYAILGAML